MAKKNQQDARTARQAQLEAARAQQAKAERRTKLTIIAAGATAVAVIGGFVGWAIVHQESNKPQMGAVLSFDYPAGTHTNTPVKYAETPPAGGEHSPTWLNCGIYDKPVPNENAVHALEHGAVWVTYDPKLPTADVEKLRKEVPNTFMVVSPYDGLPSPVVASAWGKQIHLTGVGDTRLAEFIKSYRLGPGTPELGAACTGGMDADGKVA